MVNTFDEAYREAEEQIQAALREGATRLSLRSSRGEKLTEIQFSRVKV